MAIRPAPLPGAAQELTGIAVTETVPDAFAAAAGRVDLLDIGSEGLRQRVPAVIRRAPRSGPWRATSGRRTWQR